MRDTLWTRERFSSGTGAAGRTGAVWRTDAASGTGAAGRCERRLLLRRAVLGLIGSIWVSCAGSEVSPPPTCTAGTNLCDSTGTMLILCEKDSTGGYRYGAPRLCSTRRCQAGECVDECGSCKSPPSPCHAAIGKCVSGACQYDTVDGKPCDDRDECTTNDLCSRGSCRGQPVTCTSAPKSECKDSSTLLIYTSPGMCKDGSCSYAHAEVPCAVGCLDGMCRSDPCFGVVCNKPPGACHQDQGICTHGSCTYLFNDGKLCDDNDNCTDQDQCQSGKCTGTPKPCDRPPASSCKDGKTLLSYAQKGTCAGGMCSYTSTETTCGHGCDAVTTSCKGDPCAGVVCTAPASTCAGVCEEGKCSYTGSNGKTCVDGNPCTIGDTCSSGVCKGTPKVCNTPPKNACKDASTLLVFTAPGLCGATGECSYSSAAVSCGYGCDAASGTCTGDPCAGKVCNTPPNSQCFTSPGICSSGKCTYLTKAGTLCNDNNTCTKQDVCSGAGVCAGIPYTCTDDLYCTGDQCTGDGACLFPVDQSACLIKVGDTLTCFSANATNPANGCEYCDPTRNQSFWSPTMGSEIMSWSWDTGSLQGWSVTPSPATSPVKWQVDGKRSASAPASLYFGNTATHTYYDPVGRVSGMAVSPSYTLPGASGEKLCLEFKLYKDTEFGNSYDQLLVLVLPEWQIVWRSGNQFQNAVSTGGTFLTFVADLSPFAGKAVQLRFEFDSVDGAKNSGEGLYLDNVRVLKNCLP